MALPSKFMQTFGEEFAALIVSDFTTINKV